MAVAPGWQILASLVSGGAAGALLTAGITSYRNRVQPVGFRLRIVPVFWRGSNDSGLSATVILDAGGQSGQYDSLHLMEFELVNSGNQDVAEFPFGITLADGDVAVHLQAVAPDRHHAVVQETELGPGSPGSELDLVLRPFNRGDKYILRLHIVIPAERSSPGFPELGSSRSVRFVALRDPVDLVQPLAISMVEMAFRSLNRFR